MRTPVGGRVDSRPCEGKDQGDRDLPAADEAQPRQAWRSQHTVRKRSTTVSSTSSGSRFHQSAAEKISTSQAPE